MKRSKLGLYTFDSHNKRSEIFIIIDVNTTFGAYYCIRWDEEARETAKASFSFNSIKEQGMVYIGPAKDFEEAIDTYPELFI